VAVYVPVEGYICCLNALVDWINMVNRGTNYDKLVQLESEHKYDVVRC